LQTAPNRSGGFCGCSPGQVEHRIQTFEKIQIPRHLVHKIQLNSVQSVVAISANDIALRIEILILQSGKSIDTIPVSQLKIIYESIAARVSALLNPVALIDSAIDELKPLQAIEAEIHVNKVIAALEMADYGGFLHLDEDRERMVADYLERKGQVFWFKQRQRGIVYKNLNTNRGKVLRSNGKPKLHGICKDGVTPLVFFMDDKFVESEKTE